MVKSLTRTTARVYGTLTALGTESSDVLEKLIPFFDPILRPNHGQRLDVVGFAAEVRQTYKWNFNTDIVEVFIPRLVDAGWLVPDNPDIEQTTYTITAPEDDAGTGEAGAGADAELRAIAGEFRDFARVLSPLTAIPKDIEEFEDILIEWLLYVEAFSEHNIEFQTSISRDGDGKLHSYVSVPRTTSLTDEEEFLCARFVEHSINSDPKTAEILTRIASIGLLTEVVQDFIKPNTPVETSNLVVYLDGPVALELLGVSGKAARENTQPIISELQRIGASVRLFGQSIDEMRTSLQAVLQNPRPTGPTAQAMARGEVIREFVVAVAKDPEPFLKELGVNVAYRTLKQNPNEHAYFSEEQWREIYSSLSFQQNNLAREHDSDITTLVMRQRHGIEDSDLFKSRFLAMTRNGLLAQLTRRRCVEMGLLSPRAVPPVLHRRVIAATMWLRTGLSDQDLEVPKRLLLANCERVLAIRPGVVDAVKRLTDSLGDEEKARQLDLLVSQERSAQMLMDKTLGAPSVVTLENLPLLFDEMMHPHIEEERKKGEQRLQEAKKESEQQIAAVTEELEAARQSETALADTLGTRRTEELRQVEALCRDVEKKLTSQRRLKKGIGMGVAAILCAPPILGPSIWQTWISFVFALPLGYLTITGSRFIGTATTKEQAFSSLERLAEGRRLTPVLHRVNVQWAGKSFVVINRDSPPPDDLFNANNSQ